MNKTTVATRSDAMEKVVQGAATMRALCAGTDAMREAGEIYMPRKEAESQDAYKKRLACSFLYNKTGDTISTIGNKLFCNQVEMSDGAEAETLAKVDMEGRSIHRFGYDWLKDALQPGVSFALVDYPQTASTLTLEQERALGLRPYCSIIKTENLLSFATEQRGADAVLIRANIFERVQVGGENEFDEVYVDQVRVFRLRETMTYELWRQNENRDWVVYQEETPTSIKMIPIVPLYTCRTGYFTGRPPLRDMADLNVAHWQSSSAQRHVLDFSRFPMLFGKGLVKDESGSLVIGANRLIEGVSDENSDLKHVEHSGAAIAAGASDIDKLESQMDQLAKMMLTRRTGNVTATARAIDESSANTDIEALANTVEESLNAVIAMMGQWTGKNYGTIMLSADFSLSEDSQVDLERLVDLYDRGEISGERLVQEYKRRGVLAKDYDREIDEALIDTSNII